MKTNSKARRRGFTLIEILTVIAIIAILAAIVIPAAGKAMETTKKRRAASEMNSIKVAVMQFQSDHRYMPWPTNTTEKVRVGDDMWATDAATQLPVMELLTGVNAMKKAYLQIPEKSRDKADLTKVYFLDPWGQPYQIGMDRNMDGQVEVKAVKARPDDADSPNWVGKKVMEKVLVYSPGPKEPNKPAPMKTFDIPPP